MPFFAVARMRSSPTSNAVAAKSELTDASFGCLKSRRRLPHLRPSLHHHRARRLGCPDPTLLRDFLASAIPAAMTPQQPLASCHPYLPPTTVHRPRPTGSSSHVSRHPCVSPSLETLETEEYVQPPLSTHMSGGLRQNCACNTRSHRLLPLAACCQWRRRLMSSRWSLRMQPPEMLAAQLPELELEP